MSKPIAVDFFAGAGGASLGLKWAGFHVIGIDIVKPSVYYGDEFIQADVKELPVDLSMADFVFASPPCQSFSVANSLSAEERNERYEDFIPLTRKLLTDHPFTCIENVEHAPLRADLTLFGSHFGLDRLRRKRIFELSFFCLGFRAVGYTKETVPVCYGTPTGEYKRRQEKGVHPVISVAEKLEVMGLSDYPMRNREVVTRTLRATRNILDGKRWHRWRRRMKKNPYPIRVFKGLKQVAEGDFPCVGMGSYGLTCDVEYEGKIYRGFFCREERAYIVHLDLGNILMEA